MRKLALLIGAMAFLGLAACGDDDDGGSDTNGQSSGGACAQIMACQLDCGETDDACQEACVQGASPDDLAELMGAAFCIGFSGCEDGDTACVTEACGDEFSNCF